MRTWLARLGFSFIVLALVFGWQGYRLGQAAAAPWRVYGSYGLAVAFASLGLAGVRERHRGRPPGGRDF